MPLYVEHMKIVERGGVARVKFRGELPTDDIRGLAIAAGASGGRLVLTDSRARISNSEVRLLRSLSNGGLTIE